MAKVSVDDRSFIVNGRRVWLVGAGVEYARISPDEWSDRVNDAKQAGCNTIVTSVPWMLHEPRKGRFCFDGEYNIKQFLTLCQKAGMWVVLRAGPYIGDRYDNGGLPNWLLELKDMRVREANETFVERVGSFIRKLCAQVSDQQVSSNGPIVLVQAEHAWLCANGQQSDGYLNEVARMLRENGIDVPIFNTNDLWADSPGTIDTWRGGWDDLLANIRQFRSIRSDVPCLVPGFEPTGFDCWGAPADARSGDEVLRRLAMVLAAGGQPLVTPFCEGTNFEFLGGRMAGSSDQFVTPASAGSAPVGEAGVRREVYKPIRRLLTFVDAFAHVFAEMNYAEAPAVMDPDSQASSSAKRTSATGSHRQSIVTLRGSQGYVAFLFSGARTQKRTVHVLLHNGIRLPVPLDDQTVTWLPVDVDLGGVSRLDYTNVSPFFIQERSTLFVHGPAGTEAIMSIDGSPLQVAVPSGAKPLVVEHGPMTVVVCNRKQIDETVIDNGIVYFGAQRVGRDGAIVPSSSAKVLRLHQPEDDGALPTLAAANNPSDVAIAPAPTKSRARTHQTLTAWHVASTDAYIDGSSQRYASLSGPSTLTHCGADRGYGWYRFSIKCKTGGRKQVVMPFASDRVHLFIDGELQQVAGVGLGATTGSIELRLKKGENTVTALVDNLGRFAQGNDVGEPKGLFGHVYAVKQVRTTKPKTVDASPVHPFDLRGYIEGRAFGQLSDHEHVEWSFTHARQAPILVDVDGAKVTGTFVLNNAPIAYYSGATGACRTTLLLEPKEMDAFKRGKNVLRFAPDMNQPGAVKDMTKHTTIYETSEILTAGSQFSFAKWEVPKPKLFEEMTRSGAKSRKGMPCWWRCTTAIKADGRAVWFDAAGLSKGQIYVNGRNLARYFTSTATGKVVGPQKQFYVPASWLKPDDPNEIVVFDEHGFDPFKTKLAFVDVNSAS